MSPETIGFVITFVVGLFAGVQFEKSMARQRSAEWRRRKRGGSANWGDNRLSVRSKQDGQPGKVPDAADQLRTVMRAEFEAQPLLNKSEARLFKAIDKWIIDLRPGWQVMAQVSLGEILKCEDKSAYACINSKRVDLLIVDDECRPLHAIEYQGGAHFKGAHATAACHRSIGCSTPIRR